MTQKINKEHFCLVYFISKAYFFGTIYSLIIGYAHNDAILSSFIGTLIGIGIIYLISKAKFSDNNFKFIQLFIYSALLILALTTVETYVSSFLLVKTPKIVIIIPALTLILYTTFKGINVLKRSSLIFFLMSIFSFFIILILLLKYFKTDNLLPFFTTKNINLYKSSLIYGMLSAFPNILLKSENIPIGNHIKYYLLTQAFNIIYEIFIIAVLTYNVAEIYSFPEYMLLKRISIFKFIENIENIGVLIWYFDYFFLLTLCSIKLFDIIKNKVKFILYVVFLTLFVTFFIANSYVTILYIYKYSYVAITIFLIIISFTILKSNEK